MLTKPAPYLFNGIEFGRIGRGDQAEIGKSSAHSMVCKSGAVHDQPPHDDPVLFVLQSVKKCCFITSRGRFTRGLSKASAVPVAGRRHRRDRRTELLLLLNSSGATATPGPQSGSRILLTKPGFVLKPDIDIGKRNMTRDVKDRFQLEVLKASCTCPSCFGCRERLVIQENPSSLRRR